MKIFTDSEIREMSDYVGGVFTLSRLSGVTQTTLYRLMNGDFNPSVATLVKLNGVHKELEIGEARNELIKT